MRRSICDILLIVLLVSFPVVSNASDQTTHGLHHVAFWGGGGYSGLVNGYENNTFVGGGGGLLGMGYEYRYGHLIIDAGAEFRVFSSLDKISFPSAESVPLDVDGNNMTKHFLFDGSLRENHVAGQVMIPLMIGGRWDMWYFLVGAKAGYSVFDHYTQRGSYSTTVTDADAYDPYWADMPAHGALSDVPYKKGGAIGYGLEVTASAEVGMSLNGVLKRGWNAVNDTRPHPLHMRIAMFADYGVLGLGRTPQGPMMTVDEAGVSTRSLHTSDWKRGSLNSLMVGVKFTALLQLNKPRPPQLAKPVLVLFVTDEQTAKGIPSATVVLTQTDTDKQRTIRRVTNAKGVMAAKMPAGSYNLHVSHPDYEAKDDSMQHAEPGDTMLLNLTPKPIPQIERVAEEEKQVMVLQRLFFAPNRTIILPDSEQALQELYLLLVDNPEMRIRIIGHTDDIGPDDVNQRLSEGRANSVRDDLIKRGIIADRIEAEGRGEREPIAPNDSEEGRALNRRVEFVIL